MQSIQYYALKNTKLYSNVNSKQCKTDIGKYKVYIVL